MSLVNYTNKSSKSTNERTLRVFLCHSSEDKRKVHSLYRKLLRDGVDPWLDEKKILPGQEWELEIRRAVKTSDAVIICISRNSVSKQGYIQKEIRFALDIADEQPPDSIFLIPVKLEECTVPERLAHLHYVEYFKPDGYARLHEALLTRAESLKVSKPKKPHLLWYIASRLKENAVWIPAFVAFLAAIAGIMADGMNVFDRWYTNPIMPLATSTIAFAETPFPLPITTTLSVRSGTPDLSSFQTSEAQRLESSVLLSSMLTQLPTLSARPILTSGLSTPVPDIITPKLMKIQMGPEIDTTLILVSNEDDKTFLMGSANWSNKDEKPVHGLYVSDFWIMQTEVTNKQYEVFITMKGYSERTYWSKAGWNWKEQDKITQPAYWDISELNSLGQPVVGISWYEAEAYSKWLSELTGLKFRLPTEAEWEKAARGTDERDYPWGEEWDSTRLNYCDKNCQYIWKDEVGDDGFPMTAPVGMFQSGASPYVVLDMAGNVAEWVSDWYDPDYYSKSTGSDPLGPEQGDERVIRGGSWQDRSIYAPDVLRATNRLHKSPEYRDWGIGMRLVRTHSREFEYPAPVDVISDTQQ